MIYKYNIIFRIYKKMNAYQINNPDTTPVVLRKNVHNYSKKEQTKKFGETVLRQSSTKSNKTVNTTSYKMDKEDYKPKMVTSEMAKKIIEGRANKKWTQEQLAQKCNLSITFIKSYEKPNENTVYNSQNLQKIARILEIKY